MNIHDFDDIRPFLPEELPAIYDKLLSDPDFLGVLAYVYKDVPQEQLAALVSMSPSAFSRYFKLRTGKSLSEYIIDVRLGHAARKLVDTTDSVSEICWTTGFNTLSNFNRLFRKRKGCTPKEFREKYQKTKLII